MLAIVLMELRKELTPGYKSPLQMLVEVLAVSGRISQARNLCRFEPDLYLFQDRKKIRAVEYLASIKAADREGEIPSDFVVIAKNMIQPL